MSSSSKATRQYTTIMDYNIVQMYIIIPKKDNIHVNLYFKAKTGTIMPSQICGDMVMNQWLHVFYLLTDIPIILKNLEF